jgi:hypothetical protein
MNETEVSLNETEVSLNKTEGFPHYHLPPQTKSDRGK